MSKTWKATERAIAKRLGGRRLGCTGESTADVISDWLIIEVKTRKRLPAWLMEAMQQAVKNCAADKLALVVLHETGQRHDDDLVVLRLRDFQSWFGEVTQDD